MTGMTYEKRSGQILNELKTAPGQTGAPNKSLLAKSSQCCLWLKKSSAVEKKDYHGDL